jgi:hypothetical protein
MRGAFQRIGFRVAKVPKAIAWSGAVAAVTALAVFATIFINKVEGDTTSAMPTTVTAHVNYKIPLAWNILGQEDWYSWATIPTSQFPADWNLADSTVTLVGDAHCNFRFADYPIGYPSADAIYTLTAGAGNYYFYISTQEREDSVVITLTGHIDRTGIQGLDFTLTATARRNPPSQPVTTSSATNVNAGQTLSDNVTVLETTQAGDRVTDVSASSWRQDDSGNLRQAEVCVDVFGPYYEPQARDPNINTGGKFFSTSAQSVQPETLDWNKVAVIGGDVAQASQNVVNNLSAGGNPSFLGAPGEDLASATAKVNNGTIPAAGLKEIVVIALPPSSSQITTAMSLEGPAASDDAAVVNAFKANIQALIDAIKAKSSYGANTRFVLWQALDMSSVASNANLRADQAPLKYYFFFGTAVNSLSSDKISSMPWLRGLMANDTANEQFDSIAIAGVLTQGLSVPGSTSPSDYYYNWYVGALTNGEIPTADGQRVFYAQMGYAITKLLSGASTNYTGGSAQWGVGVVSGSVGNTYPGGSATSQAKKVGRKCFTTPANLTAAQVVAGWPAVVNYDTGITNLDKRGRFMRLDA